ncbi:SAM-dependent methyltransferase [Arthrobacter ulcerisalmonis]|nr:BREX-1 system adenine-specific DNA-methyltransferase PglX [Arthrobacter ulcerisalmonis]MDQ0665387.1 SAM-dependent methyltransferase [Arthrobacter ulcerisalmonis]
MDLSLLRGFAAGVRVELVGVVGARLAGVLLPGSVERVEFPESVRRLEGVIARLGRDVVVDQVAYTWFNRLVALRFMDVNGYTGVGVVSPAGGAVAGQPEVLADAKAGHVDAGVVGEKVRERVIGLLSGSVVSRDGQGEAYKLLLAAYCNYWAASMPFMFERSGDFTELLVPDDLLSERSIVARVVRTLTPEACADVEVIGWLYQFYIAARKDEVFAGFKKNKKATALEIPAATQLFTPHWIVKYLVENSLGRLWLLNNPGSALAERMEYYIAPVEPETDFLRISGPEKLKVLDPACGSGHMLTYAFDLLFLMYEEAGYARSDIPGLILKHNLFGAEIDPRAGALAAFALVMKARAVQKSFLSPGKGTEPNICVLEPVRFTADELEMLVTRGGDRHAEIAFWQAFEDADTFGSLIQPNQDLSEPLAAHVESLGEAQTLFAGDVLDRAQKVLRQAEYLSTRYHVVVANPPYMGSGNMGPKLATFAKREYPDSKSDLFAIFIEQNKHLCSPLGIVAMVTMQSWMFLSSFSILREKILSGSPIGSMAHIGSRGFDTIGGDVVGATAFTLRNCSTVAGKAYFLRLTDGRSEVEKATLASTAIKNRSSTPHFFEVPNSAFLHIPGKMICYWMGPATRASFRRATSSIASMADSEGKNVTTDNGRFSRFHWEVGVKDIGSFEKKWLPCAFGGEFRKWYGNVLHVIDWSSESREFYRRAPAGRIIRSEFWPLPGVTWSKISSGNPSFRLLRSDYMYQEVALLQSNAENTSIVLGILNSNVGRHFLSFLSPTVNVQNEDVISIPIVNVEILRSCVPDLVRELVQIARDDWDSTELSLDFRVPLMITHRAPTGELAATCRMVDEFQEGAVVQAHALEVELSQKLVQVYGLGDEAPTEVSRQSITLFANRKNGVTALQAPTSRYHVEELVSFAVGCMFGRYSLDKPGLVLADQGDTLIEYLANVPSPSFTPDKDNVLPVLSDAWFEDDIVERFREFLRVSFGEEHFEVNLRFVEESLGKDIRRYFVQDFYKDHVQRYKKRPIYWMFSSPKGSFNALIYMHRYRPDTVSVVLNDYLHEFQAKLRARRANVDQVALSALSSVKEQTVARKESEQVGKVLLELEEWEQSVLYPLATEQIEIDLDDGVKTNYPKFGAALNNKYTGF